MSLESPKSAAEIQVAADATIRSAKRTLDNFRVAVESGVGLDVDCSSVQQADLTFVQMLLVAERSCAERGLPFALSGLSGPARSAFARAGVTPPGASPAALSGS